MKDKISLSLTFVNWDEAYNKAPINRSTTFYLVDDKQNPGQVVLTQEDAEDHYIKVTVQHQTDNGELFFGKSSHMGRLTYAVYEELKSMGFIKIEGDPEEPNRYILCNYDTTAQTSTILEAFNGHAGKYFKMKFTESGYEIIEANDITTGPNGYLHCYDDAAVYITDACRDQIIKYQFNHHIELPGIGQSVQHRYFTGLNTKDIEAIGNDGKKGFYA